MAFLSFIPMQGLYRNEAPHSVLVTLDILSARVSYKPLGGWYQAVLGFPYPSYPSSFQNTNSCLGCAPYPGLLMGEGAEDWSSILC